MKKLLFLAFFSFFFSAKTLAFLNFEANVQSASFNEGKDYYYITISAKDAKNSEVKAKVINNVLIIKTKQGKNNFVLPFDAEIEGIEAKLHDGIISFKIKKNLSKKDKITEIKIL